MPGKAAKFIIECKRWREQGRASIFLAQEHNFPPDREDELKDLAALHGFTAVFGFAEAAADGVHHGGTMTLIDSKIASLTKYESLESNGGALVTEIDWTGTTLSIVNVYAPSKPNKRVDFYNAIKKKVHKNMIMMGDWNCVPDVLLDVQSENPLNYANVGAALLEKITSQNGLYDFRRDQLHLKHEPTRLGYTKRKNRDGSLPKGKTATRLDRCYVPTTEEHEQYLWSLSVDVDFVWTDSPSDHWAVTATMETPTGDLGRERKMPREDLLIEETVQTKIAEILVNEYKGRGSQTEKWVRAHVSIKDYLLKETKNKRAKEKVELKQKLAIAAAIKRNINRDGPGQGRLEAIKNLEKEIYLLKYPEKKDTLNPKRALDSFERSENCSGAFFRTYKATAKQNWINEIKTTDWKEGVEPCFSGKTKRINEVPNALADYYRMLYEAKKIDHDQLQRSLQLLRKKRLLTQSRNSLEKPFTKEEVIATMESLPLGKSAGPNRIPNGLYRYLSKLFAQKFVDLMSEVLEKGQLPDHMLEGEISVLYKKKDRDDPRNYRPITLLNSDYKIYTKILANRMKTVVHEFVSDTQKGFVPKEIIHDCTMLLNLIEAWINDEPTERQGIFLFFDMEKAFDRVSYKFLNSALEATNFGPNFRKLVGLMYNEDAAPRRRIYANGYLSEWFDIRSGVAQGCPLSPLLFLLVAEALKMEICSDPNIKGIKIGNDEFKISQFADDTATPLADMESIPHVESAIHRWCKATGMRENASKREGIAMGKLRGATLPAPTIWIRNGEWAKVLGYPIGNNLCPNKFWNKKMEEVTSVSQKWIALKRNTYFGRNLVVQAMYFGKLRYWLYNLHMSKAIRDRIQLGADQLWWSKDPDLSKPKRFRRFVAKDTAIGPRLKGGLNNMDWTIHTESFTSQWIISYVANPANAPWKRLLDSMLLSNKKGEEDYPEGRAILFCKLSPYEKTKLLKRLPKKALYIRSCLIDFWKLDLKPAAPADERFIGSEPLWWNHDFEVKLNDWRSRDYFRKVLDTTLLQDIMNADTNEPLPRNYWHKYIERKHEKEFGEPPDKKELRLRLSQVKEIYNQIPDKVMEKLKKQYTYKPSTDGEIVGLLSMDKREMKYGYFRKKDPIFLGGLWLDATNTPRQTPYKIRIRNRELFQVKFWEAKKRDKRLAGPINATFPLNTEWKLKQSTISLDKLTIKIGTTTRQEAKMKTPPAQEMWECKFPQANLPWKLIWKLKPKYVSPRDQMTWFKVKHRNLYVAKHDNKSMAQKCLACDDEFESIIHLAECEVIREKLFTPLTELAEKMELDIPQDEEDLTLFYLFGLLPTGEWSEYKTCDNEMAAILALGWRCLYAEIIQCRVDQKWDDLDLQSALKRTISMLVSRTIAYGEKWKRWRRRTKNTTRAKLVAKRHQKYKMIKVDAEANYAVNQELLNANANQQQKNANGAVA